MQPQEYPWGAQDKETKREAVYTTDSRPETQTGLLRNSKAVALPPDTGAKGRGNKGEETWV